MAELRFEHYSIPGLEQIIIVSNSLKYKVMSNSVYRVAEFEQTSISAILN